MWAHLQALERDDDGHLAVEMYLPDGPNPRARYGFRSIGVRPADVALVRSWRPRFFKWLDEDPPQLSSIVFGRKGYAAEVSRGLAPLDPPSAFHPPEVLIVKGTPEEVTAQLETVERKPHDWGLRPRVIRADELAKIGHALADLIITGVRWTRLSGYGQWGVIEIEIEGGIAQPLCPVDFPGERFYFARPFHVPRGKGVRISLGGVPGSSLDSSTDAVTVWVEILYRPETIA